MYSGTTKEFFYQYYNGKKNAIALELLNAEKYEEPKELKDFNILFAPQSFVYLD